MHRFLPYAWFGGQCVPFAEATLSVATHALHYGTGAFGGMRALPNPADPNEILMFRADRHARRLSQSAQLLLTELPPQTILDAVTAFLRANKPTCPIYLRPFVYTSDLGIAPRLHDIETDFLIYGLELGDYLSPEGGSCRIQAGPSFVPTTLLREPCPQRRCTARVRAATRVRGALRGALGDGGGGGSPGRDRHLFRRRC